MVVTVLINFQLPAFSHSEEVAGLSMNTDKLRESLLPRGRPTRRSRRQNIGRKCQAPDHPRQWNQISATPLLRSFLSFDSDPCRSPLPTLPIRRAASLRRRHVLDSPPQPGTLQCLRQVWLRPGHKFLQKKTKRHFSPHLHICTCSWKR